MLKLSSFFKSMIAASLLALVSCTRPIDPVIETKYEPILMDRSCLESSFKVEAPKALVRAGKIYYKDGFLFISEIYHGVHVIDNRNPAKPVFLAFLRIWGCMDMAIKGQILYVDNSVDLMALDLSDVNHIKPISRTREVLPDPLPPDGGAIPTKFNSSNRPKGTVIVDWSLTNH